MFIYNFLVFLNWTKTFVTQNQVKRKKKEYLLMDQNLFCCPHLDLPEVANFYILYFFQNEANRHMRKKKHKK